MRPEYLIPITLEEYPASIRVKMDERETITLLGGLAFVLLGVFLIIIGGTIPGAVFAGLGAWGIIYTLVGLMKYASSVKKNKADFFEPVKKEVKDKSGVELSDAQLARMWVEGSSKVGRYTAYAQGRQGTVFQVGIY